jgi:hypothetical protein
MRSEVEVALDKVNAKTLVRSAHKTSGRPVSFPKITPTRDCSLSFQHQDSPLAEAQTRRTAILAQHGDNDLYGDASEAAASEEY